MSTIDLIHASPNTIEAIRKAHAIRKDLRPDGTVQYSFPSSKPYVYEGQWAVTLKNNHFCVPASSFGNLILTEDRLFATVSAELVALNSVDSSGWNWCYLYIDQSGSAVLRTYDEPFSESNGYGDYSDDYVPLAIYSQATGIIQLQYGPVRINRYWIINPSSFGGGGGGVEI